MLAPIPSSPPPRSNKVAGSGTGAVTAVTPVELIDARFPAFGAMKNLMTCVSEYGVELLKPTSGFVQA
jgi:hypothetical protein